MIISLPRPLKGRATRKLASGSPVVLYSPFLSILRRQRRQPPKIPFILLLFLLLFLLIRPQIRLARCDPFSPNRTVRDHNGPASVVVVCRIQPFRIGCAIYSSRDFPKSRRQKDRYVEWTVDERNRRGREGATRQRERKREGEMRML